MPGGFVDYLLSRLREPSTWRGLIMVLMGFGVNISPELSDAIIAAGASAVGVVGVITADK